MSHGVRPSKDARTGFASAAPDPSASLGPTALGETTARGASVASIARSSAPTDLPDAAAAGVPAISAAVGLGDGGTFVRVSATPVVASVALGCERVIAAAAVAVRVPDGVATDTRVFTCLPAGEAAAPTATRAVPAPRAAEAEGSLPNVTVAEADAETEGGRGSGTGVGGAAGGTGRVWVGAGKV
jgi:hypothetical protein